MKIYKLAGVLLLLLALALLSPAIFGTAILSGFGIGLFLFLGLGGMFLICS